jgi:hypothetical protein
MNTKVQWLWFTKESEICECVRNVFTPTVPLIHMQVYIKFLKLAQRPYCFNNSKAINCALIDYTVDHVYSERVGAAKSLH